MHTGITTSAAAWICASTKGCSFCASSVEKKVAQAWAREDGKGEEGSE